VHHAVRILVALLQVKNTVMMGIGKTSVQVALTWTILVIRIMLWATLVLHSVIV
jgi:hypothetical protein